ncbi:MAG: hypothetical protein HQM12_22410 [SAR324 cluster bacterium]|nr:hypothetical protein [SAR324 cluster bacterium]
MLDFRGQHSELGLKILATIEYLSRHPAAGELALKPDFHYFSDHESGFRISYECRKTGIHIVGIRMLS